MKRPLSLFLIAAFLINTILVPSAHAFSTPIVSPTPAAFSSITTITHTTLNYTYDAGGRMLNATAGNRTVGVLHT